MTVKEIGQRMDAQELMEWMAYFMTQDDEQVKRLNSKIESEDDAKFHNKQLRNLLQSMTHKKSNGTK